MNISILADMTDLTRRCKKFHWTCVNCVDMGGNILWTTLFEDLEPRMQPRTCKLFNGTAIFVISIRLTAKQLGPRRTFSQILFYWPNQGLAVTLRNTRFNTTKFSTRWMSEQRATFALYNIKRLVLYNWRGKRVLVLRGVQWVLK
jgi:hypothetical protein